MLNITNDASLRKVGLYDKANIYSLESESFSNSYFLISDEGTRRLMASPEVVGYDSYLSMVPATCAGLSLLREQGLEDDVNILTILRGGLNYPLEECCYKAGVRVRNMQFLSCERVIDEGVITGLDIKYEKLAICRDCTLMIGDIIATGDTLRLCLEQVVDRFRRRGGSIRRIVFFTIGGTRAVSLMEELTPKIRTVFPAFEGFTCFFYEGVFGCYTDKGCTGVNVPNIDFGWRGAIVTPEFRQYILSRGDALFEKCIIYDGGARRYEIPTHCEEVLDYWNDLLKAAPGADMKEFLSEKLGRRLYLNYDEWTESCRYTCLSGLLGLYSLEQDFIRKSSARDIADICQKRIEEFTETLKPYIQ